MAVHGRTIKTNGPALPVASAMPAQMIVSVPAGKVIHAILDNYAAHKHPQVLA
jgi:hypothetical protein